jgi:hypothetical protein
MQVRLAELEAEYRMGEERLRELLAQEVAVRETLLRINGAIQVLQELLDRSKADGDSTAEDRAGSDGRPDVLTVP